MSESNKDYLEGDQEKKGVSLALLGRLWEFLRPYKKKVIAAWIFMIITIGLELLMPFITRTAIDNYLIPHYVKIKNSTSLEKIIPGSEKRNGKNQIIYSREFLFYRESLWRKADPALKRELRDSGLVSIERWYSAGKGPEVEGIAASHKGIFIKSDGGVYLLRSSDFNKLSSAELKIIRWDDAIMLSVMAGLFCLAAVFIVGASFFQSIFLERAGQYMIMDLRLVLYRHILTRSMMFFARNPVGKLVTRITNDMLNISELFRSMLVGLLQDILMFFGIAAVMFMLDVELALVCMSVVPVMVIVTYFFAKVSKGIFRRLQGYTGRMNTLFQETLSGIISVKLMGAENAIMEKLKKINREHYRAGMRQTRVFAVFTPLMELIASLAVALVIWYGGGNVIQDRLSLGTLVAFITYMQMLLGPIRALSDKYNHLQGAVSSTERIFTLLDDDESLPVSHKIPQQWRDNEGIVFESVSFGYDIESPVFKNFSVEIETGKTVTLAGSSGGGKSTFVNLLLRLYDPDLGVVRVFGNDLKDIPAEMFSREVALVSQETILISGSVRDNIVLGRDYVADEDLNRALMLSGVDTWIGELPIGIETAIGEGGRNISQGQSQMLALARALAGNPKVLVLDEAFSQIDPETEKKIMDSIKSELHGKICISVAHRLSSARFSERILIIQNGQIVEDGDHDSLIESGGIYADMVKLSDQVVSNKYTA